MIRIAFWLYGPAKGLLSGLGSIDAKLARETLYQTEARTLCAAFHSVNPAAYTEIGLFAA